MQITYCERCSRRISGADISSGQAVTADAGTFCPSCSATLSDAERVKARGGHIRESTRLNAPAVGLRRSSARIRAIPDAEQKAPLPLPVLLALAGAGIIVGVVLVLILARKPQEETTRLPDLLPTEPAPIVTTPEAAAAERDPAAPTAVVEPAAPGDKEKEPPPSPPPSTVRVEPELIPEPSPLPSIRALADADLTKYAPMRSQLTKLIDETNDPEIKKEAEALLSDVDTRYAAMADAQLAAAVRGAWEFAYAGKMSEARDGFAVLTKRFADGPWYELKGKRLIEDALARMEKARAKSLEQALALARTSFEAGNLGEARAVLGDPSSWPEPRGAEARALLGSISGKLDDQRRLARRKAMMARTRRLLAAPRVATVEEGQPDTMPREVGKGLTGYWSFDEGRGNSSAGKVGRGSVQLRGGTSWAVGITGGALYFDGVDDHALVPDTKEWDFSGKSFTIALWTDNPKGRNLIVKGRGEWQGWQLDLMAFRAGDATHDLVDKAFDPGMAKGWRHLAVSFDARSGEFLIYCDGTQSARTTIAEGKGGMKSINKTSAPTLGAREEGVHGPFYRGRIDELRVYSRALAPEEVEALYWRSSMLAGGMRLDSTPGKLGVIGGAAAASEQLRAELAELLGEPYLLASASGVAGRSITSARIRSGLVTWLKREKPEAVILVPGVNDLMRGASVASVAADLAYLTDLAVALGIEVVVFTAPVGEPAKDDARTLLGQYNQSLIDIATTRGLDSVDVYAALNVDAELTKSNFASSEKLTRAGNSALAFEIFRSYRTVERGRLGRNVIIPKRTGPEEEGVEEEPRTVAKPVERVQVLKNGGFEDIDADTKFPSGWTKQKWGPGRGPYSVRLDRANARTGDHAVELRCLASGVWPGIQTAIVLAGGTYEVSCWACGDTDQLGEIGGSLGETDLARYSITDDWKQYTSRVTVPAAAGGATLKLWTGTPKARIWLDDVTLTRVE